MAFFQVQIGRSAPKTAFKLGFRVPEETCGNHAAQHFSIAGEKKRNLLRVVKAERWLSHSQADGNVKGKK